MPIIKRATFDMFEVSEVADYMVNLVNLVGEISGGINGEFRKRVPEYPALYKQACDSHELRMGTIQVIEDTGQSWSMINLPTKNHYLDTSDKQDISRTLSALREFLTIDKNRYSSVVLPMLNCGTPDESYTIVEPMMEDYLGSLEATIFLCMSPARTQNKPKYLTVVGPLDFGRDDEEKATIERVIEQALTSWGMRLEDYTGVVSGGYPGVDAFVCGSQYGELFPGETKFVAYNDSYVWRRTEKMPIVVKPNKARNGLGANLHLGNLLGEIGDDVILFKPKGHNNNRLSAIQVWLEVNKEQKERDGLFPKRVAIYGEKDSTPEVNNLIVPVTEKDLPY